MAWGDGAPASRRRSLCIRIPQKTLSEIRSAARSLESTSLLLVAVQANYLFSGSRQLWSSAGEGRGGPGAVLWGGAGSWYGLEQGAVEAVFRFRCQNGQIAKSFQNFIGKTHLKKIFLDGACTAKYFIKLCLFAKQPVATKEEMTRGSV